MIDSLNNAIGIDSSHKITLIYADSIAPIVQEVSSIFSNGTYIDMEPSIVASGQDNILGIVLLILILLIASIWFFAPDVLSSNFRLLTKNPLKRNWESTGNTSGLIVNTLLYLNFIIVFPILLFSFIDKVFPDYLNINIEWRSMYIVSLILIAFILFRFLFIKLSGFIFQTQEMATPQNDLYNSLDKTLGLLLLPVLLFSLYSDSNIFLFAALLILILFFAARWIITMVIGIRITKFSGFHIILYLCTLEIIPIVLLLKMLKSNMGLL